MSTRSLNKVMLIGNLTRDPELRYTPQGTAVCTFGVATNRQWTPAEGGERQEEVEYHRIVAWAKLAEICAQILHKGRKVYVEGRLQTRQWTGQDGQERSTTEIVIDTMIALGPPKPGLAEGGEEDMGEVSVPASRVAPAPAPAPVVAVDDSTQPVPTAVDSPTGLQKKVKKGKPPEEAAPEGEQDELSADDIPF